MYSQISENKIIMDDIVIEDIEEKPQIKTEITTKPAAVVNSMTAAMEAAGLITLIKETKPFEQTQLLPPHPPVDRPTERQKAIVRPHILTHIIEGFVIQEGPEPFPVRTKNSCYRK